MIVKRHNFALMLLLLASCAFSSCRTGGVDEEHRVRQALLDHLVENGMLAREGERLVVLSDSLGVDSYELGVPRYDPERDVCLALHYPSDEMIGDYLARNREWRKLGPLPLLELPLPVRIVSRESLEDTLRDGGWSLFRETYPGAVGYVELSSVGFDSAGRSALVCVARYPESGQLYVLRKERGRWAVVDACLLWSSR